MENAIKRSIEGGWKFKGYKTLKVESTSMGNGVYQIIFEDKAGEDYNLVEQQVILLDPEFWKCLGRAEGWVNQRTRNQIDQLEIVNRWEAEWHFFIDHLANKRNIDEFFNELLKQNNKQMAI